MPRAIKGAIENVLLGMTSSLGGLAPLLCVLLLLYLVHQIEGHDGDRFRTLINADLAVGAARAQAIQDDA